jgi:hypothetical protein
MSPPLGAGSRPGPTHPANTASASRTQTPPLRMSHPIARCPRFPSRRPNTALHLRRRCANAHAAAQPTLPQPGREAPSGASACWPALDGSYVPSTFCPDLDVRAGSADVLRPSRPAYASGPSDADCVSVPSLSVACLAARGMVGRPVHGASTHTGNDRSLFADWAQLCQVPGSWAGVRIHPSSGQQLVAWSRISDIPSK